MVLKCFYLMTHQCNFPPQPNSNLQNYLRGPRCNEHSGDWSLVQDRSQRSTAIAQTDGPYGWEVQMNTHKSWWAGKREPSYDHKDENLGVEFNSSFQSFSPAMWDFRQHMARLGPGTAVLAAVDAVSTAWHHHQDPAVSTKARTWLMIMWGFPWPWGYPNGWFAMGNPSMDDD